MSGHKIIEGLKQAVAGRVTIDGQIWMRIDTGGRSMPARARHAWWTHDDRAAAEIGEHLYYIGLGFAEPPPYKTQRHVSAIIDIADDGTLAGVELINDMPPPPTRSLTQE